MIGLVMIRLAGCVIGLALSAAMANAQTTLPPAGRVSVESAVKSDVRAMPVRKSGVQSLQSQHMSGSPARSFSDQGHEVVQGAVIPATPMVASSPATPSEAK
jgi:hypothetical protein